MTELMKVCKHMMTLVLLLVRPLLRGGSGCVWYYARCMLY